MPQPVALRDLISAVAEAVVAAQTQVEQHQTDILRQYFDQDGRPLSMKLQLPALGSSTNTTEATVIAAPIIALIPPNPLRIAEVSIGFDVELGALDQPAMPMRAAAMAAPATGGAPIDVPNIRAPAAADTPRVGTPAAAEAPQLSAAPPQTSKMLTVGLQPTRNAPGAHATVQLKVESAPQSEGLARLISQISQRF